MKKFIFTIAVTSLCLIGCPSYTGIVKMPNNSYMVAKQQATGFPGLGNMKAEIITDAQNYCTSWGKELNITATTETQPPYIFGNYPRSEIQFTCTSNITQNSKNFTPATKPISNLNVLGYSNFHENLSKSSIFIELKNYLLKNNMKLGAFVMLSGSPNTTNGLGNVGLDGDRKSFFVTDENKTWLRNTMKSFVLSEFSAFMYDSEGLNLSYCGDFANAIIGDNGEFGTIEYTYFLSNMTEVQRQIFLKQQALGDCNYDAVLGDVFYKKRLKSILVQL